MKASPVVSDDVECADCSIFLADLALFKEKIILYTLFTMECHLCLCELVWYAMVSVT
jgi:hypothetical protein